MTTEASGTGAASTEAGVQQQGAEGGKPAGAGAAPAAGAPPEDQKTEGAKPAEGENKGATEQPVEYKFTAPEGVEFDQPRLEKFTAIAKELKLAPEAAQKIVDLAAEAEVQRAEAHAKLVEGWAESVKADKDLGGDKLADTLATAKKAIDLGPPELRDLLNTTGFGNHPAVVKWAHAIGKALSEDKFVPGTKSIGDAGKSIAQRLYPNMNP